MKEMPFIDFLKRDCRLQFQPYSTNFVAKLSKTRQNFGYSFFLRSTFGNFWAEIFCVESFYFSKRCNKSAKSTLS